jgi:hypothetical protein
MKVVKRYVCEICGEIYEKEEDARKCEAKHKNGTVTDMRFAAGQTHPYKVDVRFDDGDVVTYLAWEKRYDSN